MLDFLSGVESSLQLGLAWPQWAALASLAALLVLLVALLSLLVEPHRLPVSLGSLRPQTLQNRLLAGVALCAAIPAITLALLLVDRMTDERLGRTTEQLERNAERAVQQVDDLIGTAERQLERLAQRLPTELIGDDKAAARWLVARHGDSASGVSDLILLDQTAQVVATSRLVDGRAIIATNSDDSFAARPYFYVPMTSPQAYLSDALRDPLVNARAAAAIGVPVIDSQGQTRGVLLGALPDKPFESTWRSLRIDRGAALVIVDRGGEKVFASGTIALPAGQSMSADGSVFGFGHANTDSGRDRRFVGAGQGLDSGWRVYVIKPLLEVEAALVWDYLLVALALLGALTAAILLARRVAQEYASPLDSLSRAIRDFDLNMSPAQDAVADHAPREIQTAFDNLRALDHRLRSAYGKLRKSVHQGEKLRGELIYVIANREKEIKQRTEELKEANETLERLSREDSLTGLANRRWFAEFLARAWRNAIREKKPISVLILDIDNFKAYNDTYGHQKGDRCLKLVAEAIRRSVGRATDLVSRYGGEEFIVVLGDTPLEGALQIAEDIRATVEKLEIPHKGSEHHDVVTVSIGATSTLPSADMQPETFLVAADRAMYRAKNDGKNQVAYSTSSRTGLFQTLCKPGEDSEKRLS